MNSTLTQTATLPHDIAGQLDTLCDRLDDVLGPQLLSVALFGDQARGQSGRTLSVAVVVQGADREQLDRVASAFAQTTLHLDPLVLTERDLRSSRDVLPIRFLDLKSSHLILRGRNVFESLEIVSTHLRLQCESELKQLALQLRRSHVLHGHAPSAGAAATLRAELGRAVSRYLDVLRAALHLRNGVLPVLEQELAELVAAQLQLDDSALERAVALKRSVTPVADDEVLEIHEAFRQLVEQTAGVIDRL